MENDSGFKSIDWQAFFSGLNELAEDTLNNMYERSYNQGVMTATAFQAFLSGFTDGISGNIAVGTGDSDVNDIEPIPSQKTNIEDCRDCWCDTCKNIEYCKENLANVPDGTYPPLSCYGCKNGMRFKPTEKEPDCNYDKTEGFNNG